MFKQSILAMALVMSIGYGCTQKTEEIKPADNATVSLPQKQFSWPEERKQFWVSVYFSKLSWDPNIRARMLPETLFEVVVCIVETMERRYDIKTWETVINKLPMAQNYQQELWQVSYNCSAQGLVEQQKRVQEQSLQNML